MDVFGTFSCMRNGPENFFNAQLIAPNVTVFETSNAKDWRSFRVDSVENFERGTA